MSANLLDGVKPELLNGATKSDGIISIAANTGSERNVVEYAIPGQSALSANQTCHIGISLCTASGGNEWTSAVVEYADSAGNANGVSNVTSATGDGAWHRHELSVVVPSGMHVVGIHFNQDASGTAIDFANPTFSYGSPVCLASSAHTPYATQDHLRSEYATKAALKVTSDAVTAEVEERGKLAGRVGTLESTSGTHTSKLEQLATSIKSLVKGESTYTDPDGASATSGIYSLVTQTRDAVTALFGSYTKTADLASTQAVKDAKKAGTDAQAAASAAQSTADSLATMIREDATGITVGKSADGTTYATGRTLQTADAFKVLDKAGNVLSSFGANLIELGKNSVDAAIRMLGGLATMEATKLNDVTGLLIASDAVDVVASGGGGARLFSSFGKVSNHTAVWSALASELPTLYAECTGLSADGEEVVTNKVAMTPLGFELSRPDAMRSAIGSYGPVSPSSPYGSLTFCVRAGVATLWVSWDITADAWATAQCGDWVVPEEYRPKFDLWCPVALESRGSGDTGDTTLVVEASTGAIRWSNRGGGHSATRFNALVSWGIE